MSIAPVSAVRGTQPPASPGGGPTLLRLWGIVRPQHLLAAAVMATFGVLHWAGVTTLRLKTSFIMAGWNLATALLLVVVALAAWQVGREARGRDARLPRWVVGLAVGVPVVAGGLLAARLLPWRFHAGWFTWGLRMVGAWIALAAAWHAWRSYDRGRPVASVALAAGDHLLRLAREVLRYAWNWAPFIVLLAAYENALTLVVRINPALHDAAIFELDEMLFGGHLDLWFQQIAAPPVTVTLLGHPFRLSVTEAFSFFYDLLYLYPIVIGMVLFLERRMREFRTFMLAFVVAGYVGYVGYVIVPVIGPAFYYSGLYEVDLATGKGAERLAGGPSSDAAQQEGLSFYVLAQRLSDPSSYGGQIPRNCFPSLHTAWGVILLIFAWRYLRKLFWVFLLPLLMLIAATSYLRWHYLTDVAAGALLAMFMATVVPWLEAAWERLSGADPKARPLPADEDRALLRRWPRARLAVRLGLPAAFAVFVFGYVYTADSEDQRQAVAAALGEQFIGRTLPELAPEDRVSAIFGGAVEMVGVEVKPAEWRVGDLVEVTTWWRCLDAWPGDWKVFVHVRQGGVRPPPSTNLINLDHHPAFGSYPTRLWAPGDVVKDVVVFRVPQVPAGSTISVWSGLFSEGDTSRRLPLTTLPGTRQVHEDAVEVVARKVGR